MANEGYISGATMWTNICTYQTLNELFIDQMSDVVDWDAVCQYQTLSELFIELHVDKINWKIISKYQNLSIKFASKHFYEIDWPGFLSENDVSQDFIYANIDKFSAITLEDKDKKEQIWYYFSKMFANNQTFLQTFEPNINWYVINFINYSPKSSQMKQLKKQMQSANNQSQNTSDKNRIIFNWTEICKRNALAEQFLYEFKDQIDWSTALDYQRVSTEFLKSISGNLTNHWSQVCRTQLLDQNFMSQLSAVLDWNTICQYQPLSEEFIDTIMDNSELSGKLNWSHISRYQIVQPEYFRTLNTSHTYLSMEFITKYTNYLDWSNLLIYQDVDVSQSDVLKHLDQDDWNNISEITTLTSGFCYDYRRYLNWSSIIKYNTVMSPEDIMTVIEKPQKPPIGISIEYPVSACPWKDIDNDNISNQSTCKLASTCTLWGIKNKYVIYDEISKDVSLTLDQIKPYTEKLNWAQLILSRTNVNNLNNINDEMYLYLNQYYSENLSVTKLNTILDIVQCINITIDTIQCISGSLIPIDSTDQSMTNYNSKIRDQLWNNLFINQQQNYNFNDYTWKTIKTLMINAEVSGYIQWQDLNNLDSLTDSFKSVFEDCLNSKS